jgi:Ca2+-binding EF-hand superfamily protein
MTHKKGSIRKAAPTNSALQKKIAAALSARLAEQAKLEHPMTLERILLKFDRMQDVLGYVKDTFLECSKDGGNSVDMEGLNKAITSLKGSTPSESELQEIFNFSDLKENVQIDLKEFVVALTLGVVLSSINFGEEKVKLAPSPRRQSMSAFFGHPKEVYAMLSLIVSAYLLFDVNGEGVIQMANVEKLLEENGHKAGGGNAMLSQERWKELDWDANGQIDLAEFVNAFTMWVDIDDMLALPSDDKDAQPTK